jgi:hypothetical protein
MPRALAFDPESTMAFSIHTEGLLARSSRAIEQSRQLKLVREVLRDRMEQSSASWFGESSSLLLLRYGDDTTRP